MALGHLPVQVLCTAQDAFRFEEDAIEGPVMRMSLHMHVQIRLPELVQALSKWQQSRESRESGSLEPNSGPKDLAETPNVSDSDMASLKTDPEPLPCEEPRRRRTRRGRGGQRRAAVNDLRCAALQSVEPLSDAVDAVAMSSEARPGYLAVTKGDSLQFCGPPSSEGNVYAWRMGTDPESGGYVPMHVFTLR